MDKSKKLRNSKSPSLLLAAVRSVLLLLLLLVLSEEPNALPPNVFCNVQKLLQLVDLVLCNLQVVCLLAVLLLSFVQGGFYSGELGTLCL